MTMTTTRTLTHLIAIDSAGLLWGAALNHEGTAFAGRNALEREVRREAAMAMVDADEELLPGHLVYSGTSEGHLPDGAWAAFGSET